MSDPTSLPVNSTLNPIIPGFAPDPSIIYNSTTSLYYLVNSTFQFFPGLPIYTSPDLVNWTLHSHAISRRSQLSLLHSGADLIEARNPDAPGTKLCFQGGLFAPTLRFEERSGTWYLLCTNIVRQENGGVERAENFWVTTGDIDGGVWSDPTYFEFNGIDPSIHFEYEGEKTRAWVCGSRGPGPATKINMFEVELGTGKKLSEEKTLWEGELKFYPEGPHIYKKGGWYWLVIAEGGTHEGHCVNIARSRALDGPYEACPDNPVLKKCEYGDGVQCTGHFDLVEGRNGQWYGTCLGIRRRGEKGVRMTHGRETFITKVQWPAEGDDQGWLKIDKVELEVNGLAREGSHKPGVQKEGLDFLWIRDPVLKNYKINGGGKTVTIKSSKGDLDQWQLPVGFVGKRQRLTEARSEVVLTSKGLTSKAGLVVYKDEHRFTRIYYDGESGKVSWQLLNKAKDLAKSEVVDKDVQGDELELQISYTEEKYAFSYRVGRKGDWTEIANIDTGEMSGPDFVGPVVGLFAVGVEAEEVTFASFEVDI
jgi:beta-xylosidase